MLIVCGVGALEDPHDTEEVLCVLEGNVRVVVALWCVREVCRGSETC